MHGHGFIFLQYLIESHAMWAYAILFFGLIIEGEATLLLGGIFAHIGHLSLWWVWVACFLGAVAKTLLWYQGGALLGKHFPNSSFLKKSEEQVTRMFPVLQEKPFWPIFFTKFLVGGINHFILAYAGYTKIKFKIYFWAEFFGSLIWVTGVVMLGYVFSYQALRITHNIENFIILVMGFMFVLQILGRAVPLIYEFVTKVKNK
ncbi:MAG: DedA family protein [Minisyncoccia bacterium]